MEHEANMVGKSVAYFLLSAMKGVAPMTVEQMIEIVRLVHFEVDRGKVCVVVLNFLELVLCLCVSDLAMLVIREASGGFNLMDTTFN